MDATIVSTQRLKDLWYERSSFAGLIVFFIALNGLLGPIVAWLFSTLKDLENFQDPKVLLVSWVAIVACIVVANTCLVILWLYWRSLPRFQLHENAILFAPHYNPDCGRLVQSIFERFVYELERRDPAGSLIPVFLPPSQTVKNSEEAHRLLFDTGARLVVYGRIDHGEKDGHEIKGFKNNRPFCTKLISNIVT